MKNPVLLTKEIEKTLPAPLSTRFIHPMQLVARAKLFGGDRFTFYVIEYDPERRSLWGYTVSPLGHEHDGFGWSDLDDFEAMRFPSLDLPMKCDEEFKPTPLGVLIPDLMPVRA